MCVRAASVGPSFSSTPTNLHGATRGMRTPTPPPSLSLYIYTHDSWTGGEREKERERGRYGVGTPGSDPSQLLPIIRVLGFTPTGSTTCSTRLRLCLRARPETLSALSSPRPPFFQTRISNVSATGSKRRLGSISISRYRSVLLAKDVFPRFSFY